MDLTDRLKQKRKEIALREGKELFMILSNATIDAMVRTLPKTKEELILIKGWGEKKIKMYGDVFLEILLDTPTQASFLAREQLSPKRIAVQIGQENIPEIKTEVLSVSEFLGNVNVALAELGASKIKGEIEEVQIRNGYAFFTLKESLGGFSSEASLGCFVGWRFLETLEHLLQNGMEVVITGMPKIYLKNGGFRVEVTHIEPVGEGALQKAFEALKKKLGEKGYFDVVRKRPIPPFIRTIGLITSLTGAALVDFQKNLGNHGFQVKALDVRVEGDSAEENIIKAIKYFNEYKPNLDILVLIRGGGSVQSLSTFNSERIADAIYYSRIPLLTGIGHERDETIAGLVSDLNCSTPTAVANFLRTGREELENKINIFSSDLVQIFGNKLKEIHFDLKSKQDHVTFLFEKIIEQQKNRLNFVQEKLRFGFQKVFMSLETQEKLLLRAANHLGANISKKFFTVQMLSEKLSLVYFKQIQTIRQRILLLEENLTSRNPEAILKRGYSIVYGKDGKVISTKQKVKIDDVLNIHFFEGNIQAKVTEK